MNFIFQCIWSWIIVHWSLFIVTWSLFIVHGSLFIVHLLLIIVHCFIFHWSLIINHCFWLSEHIRNRSKSRLIVIYILHYSINHYLHQKTKVKILYAEYYNKNSKFLLTNKIKRKAREMETIYLQSPEQSANLPLIFHDMRYRITVAGTNYTYMSLQSQQLQQSCPKQSVVSYGFILLLFSVK